MKKDKMKCDFWKSKAKIRKTYTTRGGGYPNFCVKILNTELCRLGLHIIGDFLFEGE